MVEVVVVDVSPAGGDVNGWCGHGRDFFCRDWVVHDIFAEIVDERTWLGGDNVVVAPSAAARPVCLFPWKLSLKRPDLCELHGCIDFFI